MRQMIKMILLLAITIILIVSPSHTRTLTRSGGRKTCSDVNCKDPPSNLKCTEFSETNGQVPRPSGDNAECCPLWQCHERNKKFAPNDFFTFHGLLGSKNGDPGTEIVRYKSTRSGGGTPIFNFVTSRATGNHDAIAIAGDTKAGEDIMKEMQGIMDALSF